MAFELKLDEKHQPLGNSAMHDLPKTRQSLILQLKTSSDDAWSEFLTVYEQAIFRFCRARGLQDADAHDVTQEVFSALHSRIADWDVRPNRGSFRGWLFRVARNIVVDKIRERSKRHVGTDETTLSGLPQTTENAAAAFLFEYRSSLFHWAADQVSREVQDTTWQCFWKTAVENEKASDVAKQVGVSVGTVYTAKCRVVARIREKLSELSNIDGTGTFDADVLANHLAGARWSRNNDLKNDSKTGPNDFANPPGD